MDIRRARYTDIRSLVRPAVVRLAEPEDIVSILTCLRRALSEVRYDMPLPEPDMPYALQAMLDLIAQDFVHVTINTNGHVVGVLALHVNSWPWVAPSNRAGHYLTDAYFWVERPYRRGGTAAKLLDAAKATADSLKLPLMIEVSSGGAEVALKDRFVRRCGFEYVGGKMYRAPRDSLAPPART